MGANVDWRPQRSQRDFSHEKSQFPFCNRSKHFGLFLPIRTQGKLEMATPKENMKRKMKTTIAQDISFSSTSNCACLWMDRWRMILFSISGEELFLPEGHEASYESHRQGGNSTSGNVKGPSSKPFLRS